MKFKKKLMSVCLGMMLIYLAFTNMIIIVEGVGNGGEVTTKSKISFIEGEKPKLKPHVSISEGKKLPKTGEITNNFIFVGSLVILLAAPFFFLTKRRKEDVNEK